MRTLQAIHAELVQAEEALLRWNKLTASTRALTAERQERREALNKAEQVLAKEHADVEELESFSLKALLAALSGDKAERLSRERREELAAQLRRDQARRDLEDIERRLTALQAELRALPDPTARISALREEKAACLRHAGGAAGVQLARLEERLAAVHGRQKELSEALEAGRQVLTALGWMSQSLDSAEDMGVWDMWGGGMLVTLAKHQHLDEARLAADQVQQAIRSFRAELADVSLHTEGPRVEIGEFSSFADYFFDGIFADLAVQNQIHASQSSVYRTRSEVEQIISRLAQLARQTDREEQELTRERTELIDRT